MSERSKIKMLGNERRLTGDDLVAMLSSAFDLLERNVKQINDLNVFPVPDGDTGTNMFLTLRSVVEKTNLMQNSSAREVSEVMAREALMGARGNSGVILSQFFKGLSVALKNSKDFGPVEFVEAYKMAKEYSYRAVGEPVEGTMLTVVTDVALAASEAMDAGGDVSQICIAVVEAARDSVARTPTMLPVLMEAGVVDAGGQGLVVIFEGMRRSILGDASEDWIVSVPAPLGLENSPAMVSSEYFDDAENEMYGYCTQFTIEGKSLDIDLMRREMNQIAHSTVLVGDDTTIRVHVHVDDPDPVLNYAASLGVLGQVDIQDMDEQHNNFAVDIAKRSIDPKVTSVIAVVMGEGIKALFSSLEADRLVSEFDTMNPSVKEFIDALMAAPTENVIILPNNRNSIPAAEQAAEISSKEVAVVHTKTVPEGVAAMISFNGERDLLSNVKYMKDALKSIKSGEVTEASRTATIGGIAVKEGDLIGLLDGDLVAAGSDVLGVVSSILETSLISEESLVTLYTGNMVSFEQAKSIVAELCDLFPESELELVSGGQPRNHFILSIEE